MAATIEKAIDTSSAEHGQRAFHGTDVLSQVVIQGLAVSPDGDSVIYVRRTVESNKYVRQLWRVPFTGGRPQQLTTAKSNDTRPRFSPDGRSVLFTSDRSGTPQVWVMPLHGGEPHRLTDLPGGAGGAEWSPDGNRVLFVAPSGEQRFIVGEANDPIARRIRDYTWRLNGVGFRDQFTSVWIVDIDGSNPFRVTAPTYDAGPVAWSPDGSRIGFLADLRDEAAISPSKQLWSLPAQSEREAPTQLASLPGAIYTLAWAPSPQLAFLGNSRANAPGWANADLYLGGGSTHRQLAAGFDLDICVRSYGDFQDDHQVFQPALCWFDGEHVVALVS